MRHRGSVSPRGGGCDAAAVTVGSMSSAPDRGADPTRRRLLAAGAAALLAGCTVRVASPDAESGPLEEAGRTRDGGFAAERDGVVIVESDWFDHDRQRPVPVRLYRPAAVAPAAGMPLVLFSHGLGGSRRGYSYLGGHFARQGIAALHVQHVGSDRALWSGNPLHLAARLQAAARESEAVARVADLRFALDRILASDGREPTSLAIDPARIVAAGHSYGANTALLASGARVVRNDRVVELCDARIASAILLSAPPFHGERQLDQILRPVTAPTLHVTATGDDIRIPGYYSSVTDRIAVFEASGSVRKALAVFRGGSHGIFTDRPGTGGVELNPLVKRATQDLSLAFLAMVFDGRDDALRTWPDRYREILARYDEQPLRG